MRCDEDGWYYFVDRLSDSIRRSGENVSAFEVESVLAGHPAVNEAAVFGIPSDITEEEVAAIVVLRDDGVTPEQLDAHCRRELPYFAVPRFIAVVENLPRTETGKVAKARLRAEGLPLGAWDGGERRSRRSAG
jgi:crotonobetaine/carnitine-CoA ligase